MKKFWFTFLGLYLLLFLLNACDENIENYEKKARKEQTQKMQREGVLYGSSHSTYTGKAGQIVVVAENTLFTEEIQELLDTTFGDYIRPYYPPQPKFEIINITPDRFKEAHLRLRNILVLKFSDNIEVGKPEMLIKKDYHAKKQIITEIIAANIEDLANKLILEASALTRMYEEAEWKREYSRLKKENNTVIKSELRKAFGIELETPKNAKYEINKKGNFAKIMFPERSRQMEIKAGGSDHGMKANFIYSGIMIWEFPYKKESQFHPEFLLKVRDTMLKYNALHEIPDVYMGTQDHPAILPVHTYMQVGEVQGYEFRGMFKFTGRIEPSGGKFWSFHFKHPKRNSIIAISGYLDAPPTMSPSFDLRRIQGCIYSLKIVD
jgi:hypothetical protein